VRALVKSVVTQAGLYDRASRAWIWLEPKLIRVTRAVTGRNRRLVQSYLAEHPVARLHIGCGDNELPGWLNTELCPRRSQVYLDATRPFPLPDNCIDVIYSEHMIEHVPWSGGREMLRECFRVMKPGGLLRVVTPDLAFLVRLLQDPDAPLHQGYTEYSLSQYRITAPAGGAAHVVNHFVKAWGHQFIYDERTLRQLIQGAGFVDISPRRLDESADRAMTRLAKTDRMPDGYLSLESLVLEARKPGEARSVG
jgi:predicted SAM-dependent methyltransferase